MASTVLASIIGARLHTPTLWILPFIACALGGALRLGLAITLLSGAVLLHVDPDSDGCAVPRAIGMVISGLAITMFAEILRRTRNVATAALERAKQSERRYSESFHASAVAQVLTSVADRTIVDVNDAYVRLLGRSRDEIIGRTCDELGLYESRADRQLLRRLKRNGIIRNHAEQLTCKGGLVRDVAISMDLVDIDGELYALTAVTDETEHRRSMAELLASDEKLRHLAAAIDEAFWLATPACDRIIYVSPGYEAIYGRPVQTLYDDASSWLEWIHPDDRDRLAAATRMQRAKDGVETEYRIIRPDGTVRWARSKVFTVCDGQGNVIRLAGVVADVTEKRALEERLRQTQKMESLGMLAGGVAHDFNNLLAVISSCVGLLTESVPQHASDRELVDEIDHAVTRAVALTRQLLAFSRKQVAEPVVLDLNVLVNDTRKLLRRIVGEDITLTLSLESDLSRVCADPGYMVQVLMNLAVNARDAMPRGGALDITTRNVDVAPYGRAICLSVTDTGTGMIEDVRARVFEPFFTTKERDRGTGMGLAVVHGIVDQAGGRIEVDSKLGAGTTFRVYLPIVPGRAETARDVIAQSAPGIESILLVDDDEYVRRCAARALRARGYNVTEARDGERALRALAEENFDLMLTDVVMPGLDGGELALAARSLRPMLKVLYMSGYTDDEVVRRGVLTGGESLIEKPFRNPALAVKVRQVLDGDTGRIGRPTLAGRA